MSFGPDIVFIKDHAAEHLQKFTDEARTSKQETAWRCLYAALNPEITQEPVKRNIAKTFLSSAFDSTFEVKAFWLKSGHLFIFFQGPVRKVIKDYEVFLDSLSEDEQRIQYHFFWKINEFWGYFDEVLVRIVETPPAEGISKAQAENSEAPDTFIISEDLHRQRIARYKPLLLIVEDDRVTRHMLQASMEKYCDIAVAWDAKQAQAFYQEMLPNIAFLDIELPDGDGQDLAELFCSYDPESFVVMVSGALSPDKVERCLKAGVKGTVKKPAQEAQLLKYVDQYNKVKQQKAALG